MVHVGIDLHKHVSQIARLEESGELNQTRLNNDRAQIMRYFQAIPRPAKVAIEASGTWWWIVDLLEELGHQPILSNPKTDEGDCGSTPQKRSCRCGATRHVVERGFTANRMDSSCRDSPGQRASPTSYPARMDAHGNQESASGAVSKTEHAS